MKKINGNTKLIIVLIFIIITSGCYIVFKYVIKQPVAKNEIRKKISLDIDMKINDIKVKNIEIKKNTERDYIFYILFENNTNTENKIGDFQVELINSTKNNIGVIRGYIDNIPANGTRETTIVTNIDVSEVNSLRIINNK